MSVEQGGAARAAEVRPIYRKGDGVLVALPFGYCDVVIVGAETAGRGIFRRLILGAF